MFDIKYTATWDGNFLSCVAVVIVEGDDRLRSSEVLKPTVCKSYAQAEKILTKNNFVAEDGWKVGVPFEVRKVER